MLWSSGHRLGAVMYKHQLQRLGSVFPCVSNFSFFKKPLVQYISHNLCLSSPPNHPTSTPRLLHVSVCVCVCVILSCSSSCYLRCETIDRMICMGLTRQMRLKSGILQLELGWPEGLRGEKRHGSGLDARDWISIILLSRQMMMRASGRSPVPCESAAVSHTHTHTHTHTLFNRSRQ